MKIARKAVFTFLLLASLTTFSLAQIPQIQHVIIVIQENRTPDNLFQQDSTLIQNGADIATSGKCHTVVPVPLVPQPLDACFDPDHSHYPSWENMWNNGNMNGACDNVVHHGPACNPPTNAQYTSVQNTLWDGQHGILDPYFQLANTYGFANYMLQTNMGPSFPAHQFLFSGTSAPITNPNSFYDWFAAENGGDVHQTGCLASSNTRVKGIPPSDPYRTEASSGTSPRITSPGTPVMSIRL